jgi:hypothetical protein
LLKESPSYRAPLWLLPRSCEAKDTDGTDLIAALLATPRDDLVEWLRKKDTWKGLTSLVQVRPKNDLVPVRATKKELAPENKTCTQCLHWGARKTAIADRTLPVREGEWL